ncbi:MAG: recombinase family protein [Pseudoflavonifractor sp.]
MKENHKRWRTALYMRLSKDDDCAGESSSIKNQRSLMTNYAKENGFDITLEFVDDGYSGTSFDRPRFRQMLDCIEEKIIDMVLVKDLSRLGRDYLQTGYYLEHYFTEKGVRCIAINDGYDSAQPSYGMAPIKNVVNELYAQDISRKIRSSFRSKMEAGEYIGNFAPYGYRKDPANRNHFLVDDTAAEAVRELFALADDGVKPAEIARVFNEKGILSPALYRCAQHPQLCEGAYTTRREWTAAGVAKLLKNIVYLGHMAQGKNEKVSHKSQVIRRTPREDWIVVRNTHEAIITQENFDVAQKKMSSRTCEKKGQFVNLFSGIAKCADCGRNLSAVGTRKKDSAACLACGGYKLHGKTTCSNHFIDYDALYRLVLNALRERLCLTEAEKSLLYQALQGGLSADSNKNGEIGRRARLERDRNCAERAIAKLYEDRLDESITEERYRILLKKYENRSKTAAEKLAALPAGAGTAGEKARKKEAAEQLRHLVAQYTDLKELTADLLGELVEHIDVGQGRYENTEAGKVKHQEVTVFFRFATQSGTEDRAE